MTVVDSSVWIDLFAGRNTGQVKVLELLIEQRDDICICGVILTEVLQGIRDEQEYNKTTSIFSNLIFLPMNRESFILAANLYRTLRAIGITIRTSVDCMIAAVCIENRCRLLHKDRYFDLIATHSDLEVLDVSVPR
jgi:predicted nucleic acid-binding protein